MKNISFALCLVFVGCGLLSGKYVSHNTKNALSTSVLCHLRNGSNVTYTGFKRYCFKIVLLSTSTQTPPRVKNLRAIAMQA